MDMASKLLPSKAAKITHENTTKIANTFAPAANAVLTGRGGALPQTSVHVPRMWQRERERENKAKQNAIA